MHRWWLKRFTLDEIREFAAALGWSGYVAPKTGETASERLENPWNIPKRN